MTDITYMLTCNWLSSPPLLATADTSNAEEGSLVLAGVLLSLVIIYFASKLGGEVCSRINLPPVLGELVGGVLIGISAFRLLVFPESSTAEDSLIISMLQSTAGLPTEAAYSVFTAQSEVITLLSELGVIILLFEIGLESDLKELIRVGPIAAVVAVVGVVAPFIAGTVGLVIEHVRDVEKHTDGFQWYCDNCGHQLHEDYFKLTNIEKQLPETFAKFNNNEALHKCGNCGHVLELPNKK